MTKANGTATVQVWTSAVTNTFKVKTVRARITPKRVDTYTRVFDRATGKRLSAWHFGQMQIVLLGYKIDGEAYVKFRDGGSA